MPGFFLPKLQEEMECCFKTHKVFFFVEKCVELRGNELVRRKKC